MEVNKIYCENCLDTMARMPDGFVDLTVTSPPYDDLREYHGCEWNLKIFQQVAQELYRVTKPGGVVVWVVNDETKKFCESLTSFKNAIYFNQIGFNLLDTMIYYKQNYVPIYPKARRYANQFEYMFVFSNGEPKTFNPIQKKRVRNKEEKVGFRQKNGEWIKKKVGYKTVKTKDATNVWEFGGWDRNNGHPAVFPEQLAADHIYSWSNEGDLVYDPFGGSGTTAKKAHQMKRRWIMSEISEEYCKQAEKRLEPYLNQLALAI